MIFTQVVPSVLFPTTSLDWYSILIVLVILVVVGALAFVLWALWWVEAHGGDHMNAYFEGWDARHLLPPSSEPQNPYEEEDLKEAWEAGWEDAGRDM